MAMFPGPEGSLTFRLPSRCGPVGYYTPGQTRDLPSSDVFPLYVMGSSTTAER